MRRAALGVGPVRVAADHGDGVEPAAVQRQHGVAVLEQRDAAFGHLARRLAVLLDRDRRRLGVILEQAVLEHRPQDAVHVLVERGLGHLARLDRGQDGLRRIELAVAGLHVQAVVERLHGGVGGAEVRQHEAGEPELALEDVDQEQPVLAGVVPVELVERAHRRAQSVVHRRLPGRRRLLDRPLVRVQS